MCVPTLFRKDKFRYGISTTKQFEDNFMVLLFSHHAIFSDILCTEMCTLYTRPQRWSIFRAMRCRWFIFQQRCDTDYFLERLNMVIVAIIFLDHRERLFFDYFANFEDRLFCDYSRFARSARSARSGQIETISTLNSVVNLQNVKHSYPYIKFLQLNCYLSAANRT